MKDFSKEMLGAFKKQLAGLNSFSRLVMHELLPYCDYQTGTISIDALDVVARDNFYVAPSPGRKKEVVNGDTLRNAFRSIKKAKPDHFIFSTVNQRIVITMPFIRELYESMHNKTSKLPEVLDKDVAEATTLAQYGAQASLSPILATDVATELAEADVEDAFNAHAIKPNKIKPNNNNNAELEEFGGIKKPISDDFYPSQFAIEKALSLGFSKAAASDEIKKFILFNQAKGSLWRNYDYVYIMWAQSVVERAQKAKSEAFKPKQVYSRSESNERHQTPSERVIELFTKGGGLEFNQTTRRFNLPAGHQPAPVRVLSFDDLGSID
jgi:hypothetical protein